MRGRRFYLTVLATVVGAAAVAALGLSLLAAHQTVANALREGNALTPFGMAEIKATSDGAVPVNKAPCLPHTNTKVANGRTRSGDYFTLRKFTELSDRQVVREAVCLHRHGFLSSRALLALKKALRHKATSRVSSLFPVSAQFEPTTFTVAVWSVLLLAEVVLLGRLVVLVKKRRAPVGIG